MTEVLSMTNDAIATSAENQTATDLSRGQLKLSDIIFILSPENEIFHNKTFFINYIDKDSAFIVDIDTGKSHKLRIHKTGSIGDGTIQTIKVVKRNEEDGYARQNGLLPGKWLNIYFNGDTPFVITAEITNLEEDMIELTSYPDNEVLFINFGYKGIPHDLPIDRFEIRNSPSQKIEDDESREDGIKDINDDNFEEQYNEEDYEEGYEEEQYDDEDRIDETLETSDISNNINKDENAVDKSVRNQKRTRPEKLVQQYIISADERMLGEFLPEVTTQKRKSENKERYDIQFQIDDLLDDMVMKSKIKGDISPETMQRLKMETSRFVELRDQFSLKDEYGNVLKAKFHKAEWKPLISILEKMSHPVRWIVPVVKNIKRLEADMGEDDNIYDAEFQHKLVDDLSRLKDTYTKGGNGELINHYKKFIDSISRTFQSSVEADPEDKDVLTSLNVHNDLNVVVDNLGNFRSSSWGRTNRYNKTQLINECRMDKYRLQEPSSFLLERDENMEKTDRSLREMSGMKELMSIKSLITLPYSVSKFSQYDLPMTGLHEKIGRENALTLYYKLLSSNSKIQRISIDNFQSGSGYNLSNYTTTNMYKLNIPKEMMNDMTPSEIYSAYLRSIIPKTKKILDMISPHATQATSMNKYVMFLQPYFIYQSDLTFSHYESISGYIRNNIKEYISEYTSRLKEFRRLKGLRSTTSYSNKKIKNLVDEAMQTDIFEKYNKSNNNYSTSEYLSRIIQIDGGRLFYDAITKKNIDKLLHNDMHNTLQSIYQEDKSVSGDEPEKCTVYMMTKQYLTREEVSSDNGMEIYYDKKYDTTDYGLLIKKNESHVNTVEKFSAQYNRMTPDEFFDFIREKVATQVPNGTPDIDYLTETLIRGKRRVREGEYAMLFDTSTDEQNYYIRKNNVWKKDDSITNSSQFVTSATDCNLQKECISLVQEGLDAKCKTKDTSRQDIRNTTLKTLIGLLDAQYFATKDELIQYIDTKYIRDYENIDVIKARRVHDLCKYDDYQYREGLKAMNVMTDIVKSPHLNLMQTILSQTDNGKKYADLIYFMNNYTEEHTNQELEKGDPKEMLYCKNTKVPLIPLYYRTLASAWLLDDGNFSKPNFMNALDIIIRKYGKDDGDAWVDMNSGREIIKKSFDEDEGYDDAGRKNVTREASTDDFETKYSSHIEKVSQLKKLYNSPETRIMFNIVVTLSNVMSIQTSNLVEFIVSLASSILQKPNVLPGESEYREESKRKAKEGEKSVPYKYLYDHTILYLTVGAFIIGVQTSMPGIVTKKTYPGCIRSFNGYPFDNSGDYSSVEYLACVVKGTASSSGVWKVVQRKDIKSISKTIIKTIDQYYINDIRVKQKIHDKVVYLIDHPDEDVPESLSISRWTTFLPPVNEINTSKIENITEEFRKLFISDLKVGSPAQWKKLGVIQGKLLYFSLYPQSSIRKFLLNEAKGTDNESIVSQGKLIPLFENGRVASYGQIDTFSKPDCEIETSNKVVRVLENVIRDNKLLGKAKMMTCSVDSKNVYAPLRKTFSEETIYLAFISICEFSRSNVDLDKDILPICGDKPEKFNKSDTLSERIRKLKQENHVYDSKQLERLLRASSFKNSVSVDMNDATVTQLTHIVNTLECIGSDNKYDILKRHLEIILDSFEVKVDTGITEEIRSLRNYLGQQNEELFERISGFIEDNISLDPSEVRNMNILLKSITSWSAGEKNIGSIQVAQYNCFEFVKRYVTNITHIFPEMITNAVPHEEAWSRAKDAEKRLGLSNLATNTINESNHAYYKHLEGFYNNPVLKHVLVKIRNECITLMKLVKHTPYFASVDTGSSIVSSVLDIDTCKMLFKYYMLNALETYVRLSESKELINTDLTENYGIEELSRTEDVAIPEVDPNMLESDMTTLKSETARLLYGYLITMQKHRNAIDITYMQISNTNFHTRESEKQMITTRLEELEEQDQLDLDNIMKVMKLGVWNKGLAKGLKTFVKETYDDERMFREKMQEVEKNVKNKYHNTVTDENYEQMKDDYLDELDREMDQENDDNDLSGFKGDDENGDYGGHEEEDFGYLD